MKCLLVALLILAINIFVPLGANRSVLWRIVNEECVPDQQNHENPAPCIEVNLEKQYAVLKDKVGEAQFLVIATRRIAGIESPELFAPNAPNYWQVAWQARRYLFKKLGHELPPEEVSLAINSPLGRTQDQLHIHIDCLDTQVHDAIQKHLTAITGSWSEFPAMLAGHHYYAMHLETDDLSNNNPFHELANLPIDRSKATLVVTGATFAHGKTGFILLAGSANLAEGNLGSGEELQDHKCTIAAQNYTIPK